MQRAVRMPIEEATQFICDGVIAKMGWPPGSKVLTSINGTISIDRGTASFTPVDVLVVLVEEPK